MKFGKVDDDKLASVDFTLKEPRFLFTQADKTSFQLFFAGPAWGVKEWKGKIYPEKAKQRDYLKYYALKFPAIEFNSSFYRNPSVEQIKKWRSQVPDEFLFCMKVPRGISHSLVNGVNIEQLHAFQRSLDALEDNLGITFLQLPEYFERKQITQLISLLENWNVDKHPLAIEFRHPSWFINNSSGVFSRFSQLGVDFVITDVAGRRDVAHMYFTKRVVIRFVGNGLHESDYKRVDKWVKIIEKLKENGVEEVYFFIHEPDEIIVPEITEYFVDKLNERLSLDIPFSLIKEPLTLF